MWQSNQPPQQQVHYYYSDQQQHQQSAPYPPQQQQQQQQQQQHFSYGPTPQQQTYFSPQQQVVYPPQQQQQLQQQNPYNSQTTQQFNMQQPGYDPEDPDAKGFEFNDQSVRKGFIRKVFAILSVQLAITFGVVALFVFHTPTINFVIANVWILWVAIVMLIVLLIVLACCEGVRRSSPTNYILLFLLTCCMSLMMGVISAAYSVQEVFLAIGITTVVTVGLTIFALQTKWDFTTMGGILFVGLLILMIFGIVAIFIPGRIMTLVYASLGALLFCFYLVYDIQLMMGGKHKYSISPEEYIFASLNLYIDIVNIFMYILMIIGAARD